MKNSGLNMNLKAATVGADSGIMKIFIIILLGALVVGLISFLIYKYAYLPSAVKIPTTANMKDLLEKQRTLLKGSYDRIHKMKALAPLATNQNFLVNYHCQFSNDAGYVGPYKNGIFHPTTAIPLSIANGSRGFIINIEDIDGKAMAIVRDVNGVKLSLNDMHVSEIIDAIMQFAFMESIEGRANLMRDDPCVLYLRFAKKPSAACAESIARALNRHRTALLTTNEKGDFTHRRNEDKLFLLTPADVARKLIVICNIDTAEFNGAGSGKAGLDYFINGRVWKYGENAGETVIRSVCEVPYYFINSLNDEGIERIKKDARLKYIIAVGHDLSVNAGKAKEYGIQGMGGFVFETKELQEAFVNGGFSKKAELRYVVPEPMQVAPAPKEMNSNGGIINAPKLG
jgi:hypothetical protein